METLAASVFVMGCILFIGLGVGLVGVLLLTTVALSRETWMLLQRRTEE